MMSAVVGVIGNDILAIKSCMLIGRAAAADFCLTCLADRVGLCGHREDQVHASLIYLYWQMCLLICL